ncbi:hypothetical protein MOMUL_24100 [Moorella mulderi DSM 14980]|uniref:Uncharacterized protein n=1 Tax=Moorella mulderi DSM 14980 TaxID=1122241 RepID=A0A151AUJ8_9FIRM|nr:hypothetical protein MOMUL_24100 [Moorella mulderi DSM 14980]
MGINLADMFLVNPFLFIFGLHLNAQPCREYRCYVSRTSDILTNIISWKYVVGGYPGCQAQTS